MSSIVDRKNKVFGKIAAARTLTETMPKPKLSSSFSSINNGGNSISFLSDLIKSLIGYEALVSSVVDILTNTVTKIERDIKHVLKLELKSIVSCGVDPHLPSWIQSSGNGIVIEVSKIDFVDMLRTDPNTVGGRLIYSDITSPLTNSSDFNTFLYGVIQDDGNTHSWQNIFDITFNSLGNGTRPNNSLTIKANPSYNTKTLTDLNNNFIDSLTLFSSENIITKVMDILYGSVSSNVGKSLKQLESESKINTIVDKMVNNINKNPIEDSAFSFSKEETYHHQLEASNRKKGISTVETSNKAISIVPISNLTDFNQQLTGATSSVQRKNVVSDNINTMANSSASNINNDTDKKNVKLNFIQNIINTLIKSIVSILLTPKIIFVFLINYNIVYGPTANFSDSLDFIKKNKKLMNNIMKSVSEEIIKVLLAIALKEITNLVGQTMLKKEKEKATLKLAQLLSLSGVQPNLIKSILSSL